MNIQIKDRLYDEFLKEPTKDNFCEFVKNNCGEFNEVDYKKTWPDKGKLAKIIFGDGKFTWRNYYYWGGRAV